MSLRLDGRADDQMRPLSLQAGVNPYAEGSCTCAFGQTQVLCTASLEPGVPPWLQGQGKGWITAQYAMLPRSTHTRTEREHRKGGRAREISRLVGRSLRAAVDLRALADYTIQVDCDVLIADGGTRCAAVSGGYVALALALARLGMEPLYPVAAISVGRVAGRLLADLCYQEDSRAEVDLNLVMGPGGRLVEVQATAEKGSFSSGELDSLLALGLAQAETIFTAQQWALAPGC